MTSPTTTTVEVLQKARAQLDVAVLEVLAKRGRMATYVINNWLRGTPHLATPKVLRACRRLEKLHLIEEVPSSYVVMKTWQITPAGRGAIDLAKQREAV